MAIHTYDWDNPSDDCLVHAVLDGAPGLIKRSGVIYGGTLLVVYYFFSHGANSTTTGWVTTYHIPSTQFVVDPGLWERLAQAFLDGEDV